MDSVPRATPDDALAVLRGLDDARGRLAERITSPWWYRLGAASCTASLFAGVGLMAGRSGTGGASESASMLLIMLGAVVVPAVLLWALKRSTGVSVARYAEGLGAWYAVVVPLFALGFALQVLAGVPSALFVAGAGGFVATLVRERQIDALLRRRVRSAPDAQAVA
jgi:hypothetical protein